MQFGHQGQKQRQQRHGRTSGASPRSSSTRRRTRHTSPTATATSAWPSSTPTPASSSATGAPTATSRTTRTSGRYDPNAPPAQQFRTPVHCAELSNDGLVYVCDRPNDRIQVFRKDGTFVKETVHRASGRSATARCGTSRSRRIPQQKYLYLADGKNEKVYVHRSRVDGDPHELRRRRPAAGPVLRRAQHRDGLEGATSSRPRPTRGAACRSSSTRGSGRSRRWIREPSGRSTQSQTVRAGVSACLCRSDRLLGEHFAEDLDSLLHLLHRPERDPAVRSSRTAGSRARRGCPSRGRRRGTPSPAVPMLTNMKFACESAGFMPRSANHFIVKSRTAALRARSFAVNDASCSMAAMPRVHREHVQRAGAGRRRPSPPSS